MTRWQRFLASDAIPALSLVLVVLAFVVFPFILASTGHGR